MCTLTVPYSPGQMLEKSLGKPQNVNKNLRTHFQAPNQSRIFNKCWQCFTLLINGRTFWRIYYKLTILGPVPCLCIRIKCRFVLSVFLSHFFRSIQKDYLINLLGFALKKCAMQYFSADQKKRLSWISRRRKELEWWNGGEWTVSSDYLKV